MKNKLFTLAAALMLAAVISGIYAAPALAAVIKAVLVKNVDEPGRVPFVVHLNCTITSDSCVTSIMDVVPGGRRFVIENVNGLQTTPSATVKSVRYTISSDFPTNNGSGSGVTYTFVPQPRDDSSYAVNEQVRIYADSGKSITLFCNNSGPSGSVPSSCSVVLSGYLVDLGI